jgi:UDP-3-O-acyl-N-acetylglucosamine deacetylase
VSKVLSELNKYQIPLLDGSSKRWVELIRSTGLCIARNDKGLEMEKLVPKLLQPVHLHRDDSFIVAFPCSETRITYGIDFPQVSDIGHKILVQTIALYILAEIKLNKCTCFF